MTSEPATQPKTLDQIKSEPVNTVETDPKPSDESNSTPVSPETTKSDTNSNPNSSQTQPNSDSQDPIPPVPTQAPSLEQKISDLNDQGPVTTLINEQLANRIEQKIEQKLDLEINQRSKPDLAKWLMIIFGISLIAVWLAWSGRIVWQKWF